MNFSLAHLKRALFSAALMCAGGLALHAQQAGEPILFSSPDAGEAISNLPSLAPKLDPLNFGSTLAAPPVLNFGSGPGAAPPPPVGPVFSSEAAARAQEALDRRNNWALLTPAELLGAATPESIFGLTDRNALGQKKYSTALERYTERQQQLLGRTNALTAGSSLWNALDERNSRSNFFDVLPAGASALENSSLFKAGADGRNENSGWSRLLGQSAPAPAPGFGLSPAAAQTAEMERFRQLLNSGVSPMPAATPVAGGIKTSLPRSLLGVESAVPPRVGASFTPLNSAIGKAPALPGLPSAWALSYTSAPPIEAWMPQTAPWLSPGPQPLAQPQRKF